MVTAYRAVNPGDVLTIKVGSGGAGPSTVAVAVPQRHLPRHNCGPTSDRRRWRWWRWRPVRMAVPVAIGTPAGSSGGAVNVINRGRGSTDPTVEETVAARRWRNGGVATSNGERWFWGAARGVAGGGGWNGGGGLAPGGGGGELAHSPLVDPTATGGGGSGFGGGGGGRRRRWRAEQRRRRWRFLERHCSREGAHGRVHASVPSWLGLRQIFAPGSNRWASEPGGNDENDQRNLRSGKLASASARKLPSKASKEESHEGNCDQRRPTSHRLSSLQAGQVRQGHQRKKSSTHVKTKVRKKALALHLVRASYRHVYGVRQTEDPSDLRSWWELIPPRSCPAACS